MVQTPERRVAGKPLTRLEGGLKVTGKAVYAADVQLPGMLHIKLLRSPYAHARINSIDVSRAEKLEGVAAVITAKDLPPHEQKDASRHHVLLAQDEAVFYGQPVVAVAARDVSTAEEALDLIEVDWEEIPAVVDPLVAMEPGTPLVRLNLSTETDRSEMQGHATVDVQEQEEQKPSNVSSQVKFSRGDVEQGFAEADIIFENTWRSGMMHQGYIEPHATVADYEQHTNELTVWTATQGQFHTRGQIASILRVPETNLRVQGMELGGGFGGKIFLEQALTAAIALKVKRPVKLVFTRGEDLIAATPSPQAIVELKTGMKRDGTLTAMKGRLIYDTGAYPGAPVVIGCVLAAASYDWPNYELEGFEVLTNKVSVGAIRAPGAHNAGFAVEQHIDEMARQAGLDPVDVRLRNAVSEGSELPTKAKYPQIGLKACLEAVKEHPIWKSRGSNGHTNGKRRGVGVSVGGWLGGLQPAGAIVMLNGDGSIHCLVGAMDITGTNTTFQAIVAEELGVEPEQVSVSTGDTKTSPYAGMSAGSKTLYTAGRAVKQAAEDARNQIIAVAAERLEANPDDLELVGSEVRVKGSPDKSLAFERLAGITTGFGAPFAPIVGRGSITARKQAPGFSAQLCEVEVDMETGQVSLLKWATAQDAGFAVNPLNVAGQMQGGTTQGIGIGLAEEMIYDDQGRLRNPSLLDYRMPTAMDTPAIDPIICEVPSEEGPYGARGVGEPSIVPGVSAIANAVADAIGVRVTEAPVTPERILRALGRIQD
jgi:CO/xanthine dehydrogenase Mo-binding subunit